MTTGSSPLATACPGCGKPIDSLRAGHVAIMDGAFRYFCNRACKVDYLESVSRPIADALTVRPPPVAESAPISLVTRTPPRSSDPPSPLPDAVAAVAETPIELSPAADAAHVNEPPAPSAHSAPSKKIGPDSAWVDRAPYLGIMAGFLAVSVGLAGETIARARLGFALLGGAMVLFVLWEKRRTEHGLSLVVKGFSPTVACIVALVAALVKHPTLASLASFAGLSALTTLILYLIVERTERSMNQEEAAFRSIRSSIEREDDPSPDAIEAFPWLDTPPPERLERVAHAERLLFDKESRVDAHLPLIVFLRTNTERASFAAFFILLLAGYLNHVAILDALSSASAGSLAASLLGTAVAIRASVHEQIVSALRRGIFYRDARAFEEAGKTDVTVVCARGSVLMGEPEIISVEALGATSSDRVLELASGAMQTVPDPTAHAVQHEAIARGVTPLPMRSPLVHSGLGVTALTASGETVVVGSRSFLLHEKVSVGLADARINALEGGGRSVLLVALQDKMIGIVALQDGLRPGARAAVQKLLEARIEPVLMSGEARDTCETIARALDIDHVRPEVLPQDRAGEVKALGEAEHVVAVIGHPLSDGEALDAADVSVAMQRAKGPFEFSASIASDDVRDAVLAVTLAKRARRHAQTALAFGAVPCAAALLGIAFGVPRSAAPIAVLLSSVFALLAGRDSAGRNLR